MALDELLALGRKIRRVEKELARMADRHPGVALLRTIPGVGVRTARRSAPGWTTRFASESAADRGLLRLVPCQDSSADKNRLGHITREGPAVMRKLLTEAAWVRWPDVRSSRRSSSVWPAANPTAEKSPWWPPRTTCAG